MMLMAKDTEREERKKRILEYFFFDIFKIEESVYEFLEDLIDSGKEKEFFKFLQQKSKRVWDLSFMLLSKKNKNEMLEKLIKKGRYKKRVSLIFVCRTGNQKYAEKLIEKGIDDLDEALREACGSGNLSLVEYLIEKKASIINPSFREASRSKNRKIVDLLISKGVNDWNEGLIGACKSQICLFYIIEPYFFFHHKGFSGDLELASWFISKGADEYLESFYAAINSG